MQVDFKDYLPSEFRDSAIRLYFTALKEKLEPILGSAGLPASGKWVPFRELAGGKKWYRLFGQRCEKPLKKIALKHGFQ